MNDFITDEKFKWSKKISFVVYKEGDNTTETVVEDLINQKFSPISKDSEEIFNVVYCYSLLDNKFVYPAGESNVLYIGQTNGEMNGGCKKLGFRFHHCRDGNDKKSNFCLRYYYSKGVPLLLEIYEFDNSIDSKMVEKEWRNGFLKQYSSSPIADGATFKKVK